MTRVRGPACGGARPGAGSPRSQGQLRRWLSGCGRLRCLSPIFLLIAYFPRYRIFSSLSPVSPLVAGTGGSRGERLLGRGGRPGEPALPEVRDSRGVQERHAQGQPCPRAARTEKPHSLIVWTLPLAIRVAHTITSGESDVTVCAVLVLLPCVSGVDPAGDKSWDDTFHFALILP